MKNIDAANNFFAHWINEIEIKRYGDNLQILRTGNSTDMYQCSDAMLKHMPKKALETFEKEDITITGRRNRFSHITDNINLRTDNNSVQRLAKFLDTISEKNVCRILLRFLLDIGLGNFPVKLAADIICTLETNMNKLFKFAKKLTAIPKAPDGQIIWHDLFIQHEQIRLDDRNKPHLKNSFSNGCLQNSLSEIVQIRGRRSKLRRRFHSCI